MAFTTDTNAPAASEALKLAWQMYRHYHKPWHGPVCKRKFAWHLKNAWVVVKGERAKAAEYAARAAAYVPPSAEELAAIEARLYNDWAASVSTDGPIRGDVL